MFASLHTATFATRRVQSVGSTRRVMTFVLAALAAHRQRHVLSQLDDRSLADIGLTRDQAAVESSRPIWDVPVGANRF